MSENIETEIPLLREGLMAAPDRLADEISGLTEEQMNFRREEPVWARWSPEMQLRHMALMSCRWLERFREPLEAKGYAYPALDMKAVMSGNGRHIPPAVCPDRDSLISFIRARCELGADMLARETPETLRSLSGSRIVDPEAHYEDSPDRFIDFARMAAKHHPYGWREDPDRPGHFTVELIAALRQVYWELLAHTRSIQRLKGLLGLPEAAALPREGYLAFPKFFD